ncbi:ricin-type beta-trefoil lectin domain protein [Octadecabacter sp. 1_MG-2023]|uniref:ricin-type beta-trefoil lectin domain protein n=1 Tax=unclassified Octadecabacter TaxID=196158 RepID=UPI001C087274|nr:MULTISPECIES: ricin-type beta-trefoil lectin domain protein [unclassified Octadecabacter]MBU2992645.1 RICIN domain-containing protein [Octadecabacter sp. B2R22]MDO6733904.1 ricin-type beta-trefoil lectin domain protein [Octadecabacter sp. 1_MG-2023]
MTKTFTLATAALFLSAAVAQADTVEINLIDMLDNTQDGYCLDISGGQGAQADPSNGLQGHTCYSPSGEIFVDQGFDTERFADGQLYMPEFDVCAEVSSTEAGATVGLADCSDDVKQDFVFSGEGEIVPASAPEMCLTLAEDTRTGRSDTNQIKELALEACSEDSAASQTWSHRTAGE